MEKLYITWCFEKLRITNNALEFFSLTKKEHQVTDAYKKTKKPLNKPQMQIGKLSLKIVNDNGKHCFPGYSAIILVLPHMLPLESYRSCFLPT